MSCKVLILSISFLDFLQNFQTASARHRDIQHHDVPLLLPDFGERLVRVARLAKRRILEIVSDEPIGLFESRYTQAALHQADGEDFGIGESGRSVRRGRGLA